MNDSLKVQLISEILDNYYDCMYENNACAAVIDVIYTILQFEPYAFKETDN